MQRVFNEASGRHTELASLHSDYKPCSESTSSFAVLGPCGASWLCWCAGGSLTAGAPPTVRSPPAGRELQAPCQLCGVCCSSGFHLVGAPSSNRRANKVTLYVWHADCLGATDTGPADVFVTDCNRHASRITAYPCGCYRLSLACRLLGADNTVIRVTYRLSDRLPSSGPDRASSEVCGQCE